jgi:hypothetical protein
MVNAPNVQPFLPGNRHSCPECCTLTGKYLSKLLLEPIVMHRFCKFGSKVGSVSRAKPSPDHTGKQAGDWTNVLGLSISFNPSAYLRPEEMAFFRFMWLVNLQPSSTVISLWSGSPMRQIANVHN